MLKLHKRLTLFLIPLFLTTEILLTSCKQETTTPEPPNNTTEETTPIKSNDKPETQTSPPAENITPENNSEEEEFTFSITNNNSTEIKELFITNTGENWELFELGGQTIKPEEKVVLLWTKNTKELGCEWQIKATFNEAKESEPLTFNICEQPDLIFPQK